MKHIMIAIVCLGAVVGVGALYPEEYKQFGAWAERSALWVWANIEANPVPLLLALGTFVLTVVYHKMKGKSLRDSVDAATTRITVVPIQRDVDENEKAVVKRAKARATRTQLLNDRIALQIRQRKLPDEVQRAEKETCYTEQALADAERLIAEKKKAHDEAVAKLTVLRKEKAAAEGELAEIDTELKKLADVV